jgi:hypothetical protein
MGPLFLKNAQNSSVLRDGYRFGHPSMYGVEENWSRT